MARALKISAFLLVTFLGTYGCAKVPSGGPGDTAPTAAKVQKLEDDYRSALAAREQMRLKVVAAEEQVRVAKQEAEQIEAARLALAAERDALKAEVKTRVGEREAVQQQYDGFRKSLRDMLGAADTASSKLNLPAPAGEPAVASLSAAPRN